MNWLRDRVRHVLHRLPAARSARMTHELVLRVVEDLDALSGGLQALRRSIENVPERVTVIAFGSRDAAAFPSAAAVPCMFLTGAGPCMLPTGHLGEHLCRRVVDAHLTERASELEPLIVVDSQTVRLRGETTETITLNTYFPIRTFQVVVLANFDRVELRGVFHGPNLLGIGQQSPICYGKHWMPGEYVRAIVSRREAGA